MGKNTKNTKAASGSRKTSIQLPRDALKRINLGQAFAEYDIVRSHPYLIVKTAPLLAALEAERSKCFFVGRRGTGKTAITFAIEQSGAKTARIYPELFSSLADLLADLDFHDTHQKPFRSLIAAFRRALQAELLKLWLNGRSTAQYELPHTLQSELRATEHLDFDLSVLHFMESLLRPLREKDDRRWLREINLPKDLAHTITALGAPGSGIATLIIDRIDESWDGSQSAIVFLVALMHAALDVSTQVPWARVLVFLRENVLERVRSRDSEFARLETCVVGLEWSQNQLLELIERRLNLPFNTRLPVDGTTWDYFFEDGDNARAAVFEFCQSRPRDVITFCTFAVETALSRCHERILIEDIQGARKRFSDSRLKDLGDEYSENYPQLQLVLSRFYGLGSRFTLSGVEAFVQKLLMDESVRAACDRWIYDVAAPERFARLLYDIGFFGFTLQNETVFRSVGAKSTVPPSVSSTTECVIHPCYRPALDSQDVVVTCLDSTSSFTRPGLLSELPGSLNILEYQEKVCRVEEQLKNLPRGRETAGDYEKIIGEILNLCFYRWLHNVTCRERDVDGRVVRDWIAANRAPDGFWEMVRTRYGATQVVWECKNFDDLDADCFHQIAYYLTREAGRFGVIVFRGDIKPHYYQHVKRIASDKDAMVLMLGERDLQVFLRQAKNGKVKEDHIQDRYDTTVRKVS